jgi:hypothetical protein
LLGHIVDQYFLVPDLFIGLARQHYANEEVIVYVPLAEQSLPYLKTISF